MNLRTVASRAVLSLGALVLAGCHAAGGGIHNPTPTTNVQHELTAQARLSDHAQRLGDGIARWREVQPGTLPGSMRDLSLTMAGDGAPCFTEILKDQWFQAYRYAPVSEASGTFSLTSAGRNGVFGDSDDLSTTHGPGDARLETYGYTNQPNP